MAYIVGLLVTDGSLSSDKRHIILRSSDLDLLKTFNSCLGINNRIEKSVGSGYSKKPSYRVQVGNVNFYEWLVSVGLFANKTYTIGAIRVPDKYFRDFLRGHLDGDGSIFTYLDNYGSYKSHNYLNHRLYTNFISVSEKHVLWLRNKIQQLARVSGSLEKKISKKINHVPMWKIRYAKKESLRLIPWIYYNSNLPSLNRKKLSAERLLKQIPAVKRKEYLRIVG